MSVVNQYYIPIQQGTINIKDILYPIIFHAFIIIIFINCWIYLVYRQKYTAVAHRYSKIFREFNGVNIQLKKNYFMNLLRFFETHAFSQREKIYCLKSQNSTSIQDVQKNSHVSWKYTIEIAGERSFEFKQNYSIHFELSEPVYKKIISANGKEKDKDIILNSIRIVINTNDVNINDISNRADNIIAAYILPLFKSRGRIDDTTKLLDELHVEYNLNYIKEINRNYNRAAPATLNN